MARIAGVDLPRDKRIEIGLSYIYGIGRKTATEILKATGVNPAAWRATFAGMWRSILRDLLKSAAIAASVTVRACP